MNQETYLNERVDELQKEIKKVQQEIKEMKASYLMRYVDQETSTKLQPNAPTSSIDPFPPGSNTGNETTTHLRFRVVFRARLATCESKNGLSGLVRSRSPSGNEVVAVVTAVEEMQWMVWWSLKAADAAARVGAGRIWCWNRSKSWTATYKT
ncbi:hypothetical protein LWI29_033718 [Acer saccharum]|uniref:Uncharacterized protein n=1 Tax=Acer saccharum TaxID=4024 RepID=A0AA39SVY2_ACESA|nr:hypothetical protein LWI29_033718 [Acer saccharum]